MLMNEDSGKERERVTQSTAMTESETDNTENHEEASSGNEGEASRVDQTEQKASTDDREDLKSKQEDLIVSANSEDGTNNSSKSDAHDENPDGSQHSISENPSELAVGETTTWSH